MRQIIIGAVLAIGAIATTSSYAATTCDSNSISGLVDGSFPCFVTPVELKYKAKDASFTAKYKDGARTSLFYADTITSYTINLTTFNFDATIDSSGKANGSLSIYGNLNGPGPATFLMSADLKGEWNWSGNLIGFNTLNIVCSSAINSLIPGGCTTSEVVYFDLSDAFDPTAKNFKSTGLALTSVPLPAAVWFFGSGMLGLVGIARRKG